jgi:lysozyme family protein
MIAPLDFLKMVVARWEGLYSADPADPGNWVTRPHGSRVVVGTMRGVTAASLAAHRGVPDSHVTVADMMALTLDEAAAIGLADFYRKARFDLLTWGPATAALLDFGWGAGMYQAVKSMQRLVGAPADGMLGPVTARTYNDWIATRGWARTTEAIHDMRADFYREIAATHPVLRKYLQGWLNRDDWASAANDTFWQQWGITA